MGFSLAIFDLMELCPHCNFRSVVPLRTINLYGCYHCNKYSHLCNGSIEKGSSGQCEHCKMMEEKELNEEAAKIQEAEAANKRCGACGRINCLFNEFAKCASCPTVFCQKCDKVGLKCNKCKKLQA
jgi:hypothetical protein